jgi:hypothetical protein
MSADLENLVDVRQVNDEPREFGFMGDAQQYNAVNYSTSVSSDREAVTLMFSDFILNMATQKENNFLTKSASFMFSFESVVDVNVKMSILWNISLDSGIRASIFVHHGGQTTYIDLNNVNASWPEGESGPYPVEEDGVLANSIEQHLTSSLPAGQPYRVAVFLVLERLTDDQDATGSIYIDLLDISADSAE